MAVIRPKQPALTNVLPHAQNPKYAIGNSWNKGFSPSTGGYNFRGDGYFTCSGFPINGGQLYQFRMDYTLNTGTIGVNNQECWGDQTGNNYGRLRTGIQNDIRAFYGGAGNNATSIVNVEGERAIYLFDFSVAAQGTISRDAVSDVIVVGTGTASSELSIGGRPGLAGNVFLNGLLHNFQVLDSLGAILQEWRFEEGSGNTATSEQGIVATLSGGSGFWE